eukprot:XP_017951858.1 PREDICTED: rho GTPase-activating protein 36 [Xenopus tropicalis]
MLGPILQLPAVHLQSLSELERFRLREISLYQLHERGLCSDITPDQNKARKSVRRRLERRVLTTQGALSVDSITELDNGDARLLEALQLSHSNELQDRRKEHNQKLSLNPVYKQVPRIVERCCSHLENYGLHTVGIFRIGSSKKRVEQLREEFAVSGDVLLGEDTCVHDVSALLKAFLRDLPDPVLPRELYSAFIHTAGRGERERLNALQLLVFALPMCNADTLLRILQLLHNVALHEHDTTSSTGEQVPGNKMSVTNLATVFGPNLLQGVKSPESEIQSFQDSSAQIRVTETLIQHYQELYMVPSHIHGDILMSLLHSDPEVIDFLLRRKFSVAQILDGAAQSSLDVQQLKKDLRCSLLPHRPLQTLMEMLSIGVKSDFLDSRLSRRRPSRSQEDLTVCPSEPPTKTIFPSRPRFLPLFSKATASPQSHSLDTPSPVLSPSKLQMVTEEITKTFGFGKTAV